MILILNLKRKLLTSKGMKKKQEKITRDGYVVKLLETFAIVRIRAGSAIYDGINEKRLKANN